MGSIGAVMYRKGNRTLDEIRYHLENNIATLTINRPQALNAMSATAIEQLIQLLRQADGDPDVLCVVICAAGEKAFCVGGDIKAEVHMDGYSAYDFGMLGQSLMRTIRQVRMPVITAAQGYALGAGMEIVLASDFAFLSTDAKLAIPSINLGSMPGFGGTQLLPRVVGAMRAKELLMTGRHIGADEAVSLGLALKAVTREALMSEAYAFAQTLTAQAPFALRAIKTAVNQALETDLETGFLLEAQLFSRVQASADKQTGMQAFLNKTKPEQYINR